MIDLIGMNAFREGQHMCKESGSATSEVMIENERVRVTKWSFARQGDDTGWHRHEYDYVVVPLFDGRLEIDLGHAGMTKADLQNGVPYFRTLGVEHNVINANAFACAFIEIELLDQPTFKVN